MEHLVKIWIKKRKEEKFMRAAAFIKEKQKLQSVLGRNKCMCCSSHALRYGRVQSCAIRNSFASYGGVVTRAYYALTRLNVSEPEPE